MTLILKILPRAEQDAQHIFDYISKRSLRGAAAWWAAFEDAATRALDDFARFALASENDLFPFEIRQVLFKTRRGRTYRYVFTVVGAELRILRVRGPGQPPLQPDELPKDG